MWWHSTCLPNLQIFVKPDVNIMLLETARLVSNFQLLAVHNINTANLRCK
jgi:hypothetical protein